MKARKSRVIKNYFKSKIIPIFQDRIPIPLPLHFLVIFVAIYSLLGLTGHSPWKTDDAVGFGVVYQMFKNGQWLVPMLANEAFLEKPPLYYWVAVIFTKLFSFSLPLHDAARLASGFFTVLTMLFMGLAGRELYGKNQGIAVVLILMGCLGILVHAHDIVSDIAGLAGLSVFLYGLTLFARRPKLAGLIVGCGLGVYFLCQGLILLPMLIPLAIGLPLLLKSKHQSHYPFYLIIVIGSALPWLVLWPLLLHQHSPELFTRWWTWNRNILIVNARFELFYYLKTLLWSSWPAWPLALWSLWHHQKKIGNPNILLPLITLIALFFLTLILNRETRELNALPLLLPLSLLAGASIAQLRRGAANALDWFGMMTFTLAGLFFWLAWFALLTGHPMKMADRLAKLEPGYVQQFLWLPFVVALLLSALWIAIMTRAQRSPYRSVTHWAAGVILFWGLMTTVLLSWIDYSKSYQAMAVSLAQRLPAKHSCINSLNLGEPQRASLDYFAGIITRRLEAGHNLNCKLLLVQGSANNDSGNPGSAWNKIWEGNRPGDRVEKYRLYERK